MRVMTSLTELPDRGHQRTALTFGAFDGIHLGHQALLRRVVALGMQLDAVPTVVSFWPHPRQVLSPSAAPPLITTREERRRRLAEAGVELFVELPFEEVRGLSAETFASDLLVRTLHAAAVVVGPDQRFGRDRQGDGAFMTRILTPLGVTVAVAEPVLDDGGLPYSSSRIRAAVEAGDVLTARRLLGRPHRLDGIVVRGDQLGRTLGFPTANLACETALVPKNGIYASWAHVRGVRHAAVTAIGTRPTFDGQDRRIETYVFDFDSDLYGQPFSVDLIAHLRDELRFDGIDPLIAQMHRDCEASRRILAAEA
ncbi:MAG: bifunctional riboflavin kinase/FAD synthetase [Myxococcales bacterium]|nr:bifunctional riboflavin kinase/FAD synthetase [Myxococcales bacterium]